MVWSHVSSLFGLDHKCVVPALRAGPWVDILEAFKLELGLWVGCLGLGLLDHSVVSVDLCIRHSYANWAL